MEILLSFGALYTKVIIWARAEKASLRTRSPYNRILLSHVASCSRRPRHWTWEPFSNNNYLQSCASVYVCFCVCLTFAWRNGWVKDLDIYWCLLVLASCWRNSLNLRLSATEQTWFWGYYYRSDPSFLTGEIESIRDRELDLLYQQDQQVERDGRNSKED
jgi:hypothetical protein